MELVQYQDYEEYKKAMNTVLNRTVEDFVMTGYLLKQGRDASHDVELSRILEEMVRSRGG